MKKNLKNQKRFKIKTMKTIVIKLFQINKLMKKVHMLEGTSLLCLKINLFLVVLSF